MHRILKPLIAASLLVMAQTAASAQDHYLMPAFGDGMVYFNNQRPAQGKLNICALDNTLRFLDADGKELAATDNGSITKVRIDTVWFLHANDAYFRMYPLAVGVGVALKHDLRVIPEAKKGAYGTTSQTSSINQKSVLYADGVTYNLNTDRNAQYEETDILQRRRGTVPQQTQHPQGLPRPQRRNRRLVQIRQHPPQYPGRASSPPPQLGRIDLITINYIPEEQVILLLFFLFSKRFPGRDSTAVGAIRRRRDQRVLRSAAVPRTTASV